MERKSKILLIVAGVMLVLALIVAWLLSRQGAPEVPTVQTPRVEQTTEGLPVDVGVTGDSTTTLTPTPVAPAPQSDPMSEVKRLAMSFAERYGSYSSLGDFQNIEDLKPVMTAEFATKTDADLRAWRSAPAPTEYRGTTTRALSTTVDTFDEDEGVAVVIVKTQRADTVGDSLSPTVRYQDVRIGLLRQADGSWRVNSAAWR